MARTTFRDDGQRSGGRQDGGGRRGDHSLRRTRRSRKVSKIARWSKLAGASICLLVLALWLASLIRGSQPVPLFVCAITDYAAPVPPNAWADEDGQRLASIGKVQTRFGAQKLIAPTSWPRKEKGHVTKETLLGDDDGFLTEWLRKSLVQPKAGLPEQGVLLIYLSAHGVSCRKNGDGAEEPALLLESNNDATGNGSDFPAPGHEKLFVRDLLDLIQTTRKMADKKDRLVVLFLDCGRFDSHWPTGVVRNNFAELLKDLLEDEHTKKTLMRNLVVFNAAGPGQRSWAFPKERRSAFGHAVFSGLKGEADGQTDDQTIGQTDGKISLLELEIYISKTVSEAAARRRFARQRPQVFWGDGVNKAQPVVYASKKADQENGGGNEAGSGGSKTTDAEDTLRALWVDYEKLDYWRDDAKGTFTPQETAERLLTFSAFESGLLRLEQLAESGAAYQQEFKELGEKLRQLLRDGLKKSPPDRPAHSIALDPRTPDADEALVKLLQENLNPAGPEDGIQKKRMELKKVRSYPERAWAAWTWVLGRRDRSEMPPLKTLLELVGSPPAGEREYVEIRFLRLLSSPYLATEEPVVIHAAIVCRNEAEQSTAFTRDVRVYDVVAPVVAEADRLRREAEDKLFTEETKKEDFDRPIKLYQHASRIQREFQQAIALVDKTLYRATVFAEWAQRLAAVPPSGGDSTSASKVAELTISVASLARSLDQELREVRTRVGSRPESDVDAYLVEFNGENENWKNNVQPKVSELRSKYSQLQNMLDSHVVTLQKEKARDRHFAEAVRALLTTPLAGGTTRNELRDTLKNVNKDGKVPEESEVMGMSDNELVALVRPFASQGNGNSKDKKQRENDDLAHLSNHLLQHRLQNPEKALGDRESAEAPGRLWEADRQLRPICSLLTFSSRTPPEEQFGSPFSRLVRFYQSERLLLHAERALDDFYGDLDVRDEPLSQRPPYFARIAKSYLDGVGRLADEGGGQLWPRQVEHLKKWNERLENRTVAAEKWKQDLVLEDALFFAPQSSFERGLQFTVRDLPTGVAAVSARDKESDAIIKFEEIDGKTTATHRMEVPSQQPSELTDNIRLQFPNGPPDPGFNEKWTISLFFRGHVKPGPLSVVLLKAAQKVVVAQQKKTCVLCVHGEIPNEHPGSIAFLLDCSRSMKDPPNNPRIVAVRDSLYSVLEDMGNSNHYRAALWLFGNRRFARGTIEPLELQPGDWNDNDLAGEEDPAVSFENDIHFLWETEDIYSKEGNGRRNGNDPNAHVLQILDAEDSVVRPWGYTPLYRAIRDSIQQDFFKSAVDLPRTLVVLTDGRDLVPGGASLAEPQREILWAMRDANEGPETQPIKLLVFSNVNAVAEFNDILRAVGGSYKRIGFKKNELLRELGLAARLSSFEVIDQTGQKIETVQLDKSFEFTPSTGIYRVQLDNKYTKVDVAARFVVEGGESFDFRFETDGNRPRIVHAPTLRETAGNRETGKAKATVENPHVGESDGENDLMPRRFVVRVHTPDVSPPKVQFYVSIQNQDSKRFSPRPKEFWAEISPLQRDGNGEWERVDKVPFVFYDRNFDTGYSTPILKLPTTGWPEGVFAAEINLWFRTRPVTRRRYDDRKTIGDLELTGDSSRGKRGEIHLSDDTVTYWTEIEQRDSGVEVVVTEKHTQPGLNKLKVEIDRPAAQITRAYYPEHNQVVHRFLFENVGRSDVRDYQLIITAAADLKKEGVAVKPLIVEFGNR